MLSAATGSKTYTGLSPRLSPSHFAAAGGDGEGRKGNGQRRPVLSFAPLAESFSETRKVRKNLKVWWYIGKVLPNNTAEKRATDHCYNWPYHRSSLTSRVVVFPNSVWQGAFSWKTIYALCAAHISCHSFLIGKILAWSPSYPELGNKKDHLEPGCGLTLPLVDLLPVSLPKRGFFSVVTTKLWNSFLKHTCLGFPHCHLLGIRQILFSWTVWWYLRSFYYH